MVSPSGHIYSKEAIFEYLLKKSKEIKEMEAIFNEQEVREGEIDRTIAQCCITDTEPLALTTNASCSLSHTHIGKG